MLRTPVPGQVDVSELDNEDVRVGPGLRLHVVGLVHRKHLLQVELQPVDHLGQHEVGAVQCGAVRCGAV
jgi:hypothetical protein